MSALFPVSKKILNIIFAFILIVIISGCHKSSKEDFFGSFYANDCGVSHGGFEWAGGYKASLVVSGNKGDLTLTFEIGLGDPLTVHQFSISDFVEAAGNMTFKIEGKAATLVLVENDTIWNGEYSNHFVANKSDDLSEKIGSLPIEPFYGFKSHYYIELRLRPKQAPSRFLGIN